MDHQIIHETWDWFSTLSAAVTISSLLVRYLPCPEDLAEDLGQTTSKGWYRVFYRLLRQVSLNPIQPRNGKPEVKP